MSIRHWPGGERPREKLLERGTHALSDAELVALLLGSGTPGRSAVELARSLIADFGSLRELLNAEAQRCLAQAGIGPARYAILKAAVELARRHLRAQPPLRSARAEPGGRAHHAAAQGGPRPGGHPRARSLHHRRRTVLFLLGTWAHLKDDARCPAVRVCDASNDSQQSARRARPAGGSNAARPRCAYFSSAS